jgi:hypothetical protein
MIKVLGPGILSIPCTEELLVTEEGWNMHMELQMILMQNMEQGEWKWWDGINSQPINTAGDINTAVQPMPNKSTGNAAARTWVALHLCQENTKKIQKIINAAMQMHLGAMHVFKDKRTTSPEMIYATRQFVMVSISWTKDKQVPANSLHSSGAHDRVGEAHGPD